MSIHPITDPSAWFEEKRAEAAALGTPKRAIATRQGLPAHARHSGLVTATMISFYGSYEKARAALDRSMT